MRCLTFPLFPLFLSTLSLRRATCGCCARCLCWVYFYPRSPCGERLHYDNYNLHCVEISIHALLAESDLGHSITLRLVILFLSTLSLRRATRRFRTIQHPQIDISIHALLAESDARRASRQQPAGEISIHALLAESDRQVQRLKVASLCISIHALLAESDTYLSILF